MSRRFRSTRQNFKYWPASDGNSMIAVNVMPQTKK